MTNEFKELVENQLQTQLGEIELTAEQKAAVVDFLIENGTLTVTKLVDLGDFYHGILKEGANRPAKSLIVNDLIIYVFDKEIVTGVHQAGYVEYLQENDLHPSEYDYGQYLTDNELVHETTTEPAVELRIANIGQLYLGALAGKQKAENDLAEAEVLLERIQPLVSQNFIPVAQ